MTGHTITTLDQLTSLYGSPGDTSLKKVSDALTPAYRRMIEAAPFIALASCGPEGLDCSPRGDRGAAVTVIDDRTVAIPDRRGNRRLDTLRNLVNDPRCAILFLIPGVNECIRINGTAVLCTDPDLTARFEVDGIPPTCVILVTINEVYFQCARALIRSGLWDPALHRDRGSLPSAGEMTKSAFDAFDAIAYDAELPDRQARTLY
ncbi:pyridoxamine 5'-phosphate oxidase family protein [Amaricoccus tamworthensis]|uniref:pyridoxamine 5'-phosphate oxidase family protein n=1 Tax=Amaricoccus tamworthensis TaxID=57002 RepID=UPI003C7D9316